VLGPPESGRLGGQQPREPTALCELPTGLTGLRVRWDSTYGRWASPIPAKSVLGIIRGVRNSLWAYVESNRGLPQREEISKEGRGDVHTTP